MDFEPSSSYREGCTMTEWLAFLPYGKKVVGLGSLGLLLWSLSLLLLCYCVFALGPFNGTVVSVYVFMC